MGDVGVYPERDAPGVSPEDLARVVPGGAVLSAGCGAGRYDGLLLDAGHPVVGIDQSAGMLRRAREHFPQVRYEKMGMQEMAFREEFDGVICTDAMVYVCPEDYAHILGKFQEALKPGGVLYFTMHANPTIELEEAYERAKAMGLPVVFGEVVDREGMYRFYPSLDRVHEWIDQAGLAIEEEGEDSGYRHFVARKKRE